MSSYFYPRSPCGERPYGRINDISRLMKISIHALLAESDSEAVPCRPHADISIHALLAESDLFRVTVPEHVIVISIHALLAESDVSCNYFPFDIAISIHALLAESDSVTTSFQGGFAISIHALLAESDTANRSDPSAILDFYPRSPCGERLGDRTVHQVNQQFLSTLSLRRATGAPVDRMPSSSISIHALLAESDSKSAQNSGALLRI